jgi:ATP/ADP translocase
VADRPNIILEALIAMKSDQRLPPTPSGAIIHKIVANQSHGEQQSLHESSSSLPTPFFKPANHETERAERQGLLPLHHHHDNSFIATTSTATAKSKRPSCYSLRRKEFDIRLRHILEQPDSELDWRRAYWLGLALFLALCVFWILDSMKDPVFGAITGDLEHLQPIAKLISVAFTICIVILTEHVSTTKKRIRHSITVSGCQMEDHEIIADATPWQTIRTETSQEAAFRQSHNDDDNARISVAIFSTIGVPYCIFFGLMAYCLQFNPNTRMMLVNGNDNDNGGTVSQHEPLESSTQQQVSDSSSAQVLLWRYLAYAWFAAIESYGSIVVATFWWYVNSTVSLHEAEAFYGIIIGAAQFGALAGSTMITMHMWTSVTLTISACLIMILHIVVMQLYDRNFPPTQQQQQHLVPHVMEELDDEERLDQPQHQQDTVGSGLYLILQHNYVLLILGVSCLDEISLTCLNYQMTMIGWARFDAADFGTFIGRYGQLVNLASIVLSAIVFPRLLRRTGLKWTIRIFPTMLLLTNTIAFWVLRGNLLVLFLSMALMKAMTYSIHDPAKELLYIPTSNAIKFKAKFWIDIVGARLAKAIGSSINHIANGNIHQSIRYGSLPSLLTALALLYACSKVGREFETLVENGTIVGIEDDERQQPPRTHYSVYSEDDDEEEYLVGETPQAVELTAT